MGSANSVNHDASDGKSSSPNNAESKSVDRTPEKKQVAGKTSNQEEEVGMPFKTPIPVKKLNDARDLAAKFSPMTINDASPAAPHPDDGLTDKEKEQALNLLETTGRTRTSRGAITRQVKTADDDEFEMYYGWVCQAGYYPENLSKRNQDNLIVMPNWISAGYPGSNGSDTSIFGVFDGHGQYGTECSTFSTDNLERCIKQSSAYPDDIALAFEESFPRVNTAMHQAKHNRPRLVDDRCSGTTAICTLIQGKEIVVANVGDSRAIMGEKRDGRLVAYDLSIDQTPYRKDERDRCKRAGAAVMTMDQLEGYKPYDPNQDDYGNEEDDDGDPPRLWVPGQGYPGVAFTRSLGDEIAESIGCHANPEMAHKTLQPTDRYLIIASDGVFEFLSSQTVLDMASQFDDPLEAAKAIVAEAYKLWLYYEVRTDDITCIVVKFQGGIFAEDEKKSQTPSTTPRSPTLEKAGTMRGFKTLLASQSSRPVRRMMSRLKRQMIQEQEDMDDSDDEEEAATPLATPRHLKSKRESAEIESAVKANFLFRHLNEDQKRVLFDAFYKTKVSAGDVIIKQGDKGDRFYVIRTGVYEVFVKGADEASKMSEHGSLVHTYRSSADQLVGNPSFGELALMYGKPRAATVIACEDGELWALDRKTFKACLMKSSSKKLVKTLKNVEVLSSLSKSQLRRLADILTEVKYQDGDVIIRQGDDGDSFYVLLSGNVECTINPKPEDAEGELAPAREGKVVLTLEPGGYFGERALLQSEKRAANVIATGGPVVCLYISRTAFEEVLGPLSDLIAADGARREAKAMSISHMKSKRVKEGLETSVLSDFKRLDHAILEIGSFGHMWITKSTANSKLYTMSSYNKQAVDEAKQGKGVRRNRDYLLSVAVRETKIQRPKGAIRFIPNVVCTFNSEIAVHVLYEDTFCGNVQGFLEGFQKKPEKISAAQWVCACVIAMLSDVRGDCLLLRGVNAEMLMVNSQGYVKLPDLKFAKFLGDLNDRTFTMCGAAEYMSPEQVQNTGHGLSADCWSLGVLAFEFLTGASPFASESEGALYKTIAAFNPADLSFPDDVPDEAADFCRKLLDPSPYTRMVSEDAEKHPWMSTIDFKELKYGGIGFVESPLAAEAKSCITEVEESGNISDIDEASAESFYETEDEPWHKNF